MQTKKQITTRYAKSNKSLSEMDERHIKKNRKRKEKKRKKALCVYKRHRYARFKL